MRSRLFVSALVAILATAPALAGEEAFHPGKLIPKFGKVAAVAEAAPIPKGTEFRVRFDIGGKDSPGEINRQIESVARFLNMHVEAGVPAENIHLAVVLHGGIAMAVTRPERYRKFAKVGEAENVNAPLVSALVGQGVVFAVCGQTAAYHGIKAQDLLPGVDMALSAMTAHALLAKQGYELNPF